MSPRGVTGSEEKTVNVPENPFYIVKSRRLRYAFLSVLVIFIVFLIASAIIFRQEITLENFRYLLKDIEMIRHSGTGEYESVSYAENSTSRFTSFRGNFTVVNSGGVTFFDGTGSKTNYPDGTFSSPVAKTSNKYLILFGVGENTYSVCNNFGSVYSETFNYPISGVSLSDSGYYTVISRTAEYRSAVYLYSPSFKKMWTVFKDKYVVDTAVDEANKRVFLLYFYVQDGDYVTELSWLGFDGDSSDENIILKQKGQMPIRFLLFRTSGYAIMTDSSLFFFDGEDRTAGEVSYGQSIPLNYALSNDRLMMLYRGKKVDGSCTSVVYLSDGTELYRKEEKGNLIGTAGSENGFAVLFGTRLVYYGADGEANDFAIEQNPKAVLFLDDETFLVCYDTRAVRYSLPGS